jgi:hypothetical protein
MCYITNQNTGTLSGVVAEQKVTEVLKMKTKSLYILFLVFCLTLLVFPTRTTLTVNARLRPLLTSTLRSSPLTIDGIFTAGEWTNLQLHLLPADGYPIEVFTYFENDLSKLYVMVDAVGDTTNNQGAPEYGENDECLLVFHSDAIYTLDIFGQGNKLIASSFNAAIGFHDSPNSATSHKIYEWSIPLSSIHTNPGATIDFSSPKKPMGTASMTFDGFNANDNVYPSWLPWDPNVWRNDIPDWAILELAGHLLPVGGAVMPTNKLEIITPYLALAGLVMAVSAVVVRKRRD